MRSCGRWQTDQMDTIHFVFRVLLSKRDTPITTSIRQLVTDFRATSMVKELQRSSTQHGRFEQKAFLSSMLFFVGCKFTK